MVGPPWGWTRQTRYQWCLGWRNGYIDTDSSPPSWQTVWQPGDTCCGTRWQNGRVPAGTCWCSVGWETYNDRELTGLWNQLCEEWWRNNMAGTITVGLMLQFNNTINKNNNNNKRPFIMHQTLSKWMFRTLYYYCPCLWIILSSHTNNPGSIPNVY